MFADDVVFVQTIENMPTTHATSGWLYLFAGVGVDPLGNWGKA
jgi:hypothetical protein